MSHPYDQGDRKQVSVLGPTLKFKGDLTANEDLVIQGQVEGKINHSSNLTIGKEGKVKANVRAEHITVEGTVDGDLEGRKGVAVKETANVTGNIASPTVTLHEGSTFNGNIDMSGNAKTRSQPAGSSGPSAVDGKRAQATDEKAGDSGSSASQDNQTAGAA